VGHAAHKPSDAVVEIVPLFVRHSPVHNLQPRCDMCDLRVRCGGAAHQRRTSDRLPAFLDSMALNCTSISGALTQKQGRNRVSTNLQAVLVREETRSKCPHLLPKPPAHAEGR
jgi:hypothetical protein